MENEEVFTLPKLGPRAHSSLTGILSKYQNDMTTKFLCIVGKLDSQIKEISQKCIQNLDQNMTKFQEKRCNVITQQNQIIESMATTHESFDSIKSQILALQDELFSNLNSVKIESLKIYQNSYQETAPFISEARQSSELIIKQIPPAIADRLEHEISRFNSNFIQNKQALLRTFYSIKIDITKQQNQILKEFEERKETWNVHHFQLLIQNAKDKFNLTSPIDYSSIYQEFYIEQQKFNNCFQKSLTNISLITPPDQISTADLDNWWKEIEDLISLHSNFIHTFYSRIQTTLNENIEENNRMMSSLEEEFVDLTNPNEAQPILDELNKMKKAFEIINISFVEKINKYWNYRKSCLIKGFESIKDFYAKTIEIHNSYSSSFKDREMKQKETKEQIETSSKQSLEKLELELKSEIEKIQLSTCEKEIDAQSKKCSQILSLIENEYRNKYQKLINLYDEQPSIVTKIFETYEPKILEIFNLKLLVGLPEFSQTVTTNRDMKSNRNTNRTDKSNQNRKRTSRGVTASISEETREPISIVSGAQFEITEKFTIIPTFEDFLIVETPQQTGKGTKTKAKQVKKTSPKNSKQKTQEIEFNPNLEEPETIEFDFNDVIPKINDVISIWIPLPTMLELNEWVEKYRLNFLNYFYNHSRECLNTSMNEELKMMATDELNENLRVQNPRDGLIQINVVEARKIKLTSQKDQFALYFRRITQQFNSALTKIKYNLSVQEKHLFDQYDKEKQMITEINSQSSVRTLTNHLSNFNTFDKKVEIEKENVLKNQETTINELLNVFKTKNERFKQMLFGQDDNNQESKIIIDYLNKMDQQMNLIKEKFDQELTDLKIKTNSLHDQITSEFKLTYDLNLTDLTFLENISLYKSEYNHQCETLSIVNKSQEIELENIFNSIDTELNQTKVNHDHENQVIFLLNQLELMRMKIMKRCSFLNHLKSHIPDEPILINFTFNEVTQEPEQEAKTKKSIPKPQKNVKPKPTPKNDSKASNKKDADNYQKRIDNLKNEFKEKLTRLSNDYYAQFKTRKVPISRPNEIPMNQSLFLEKVTNSWKEMSSEDELRMILDDSILKLRFQVSSSLTKANELISCICRHFLNFYLKKVDEEITVINDQFNSNLNTLREERKKHQSFLNLNLADSNKKNEFDQLIEKEQIRTKNEEELTHEIERNVALVEMKYAEAFIGKLPCLMKIILEILDRFVLIEDLNQGPNPNLKRKTMRELLKDKHRKSEDPSFSNNDRPFNLRNWPNSPPKLTSLFHFPAVQELIRNEAQSQMKTTQQSSKDKKRVTKNSSRKSSRKVDPAFRPDSQHPSARKTVTSKQSARQEIDSDLSSYDTHIHRSAIIERNRTFSDYNSALFKRAMEFNTLIGSIKSNTSAFVTYWTKSILSFKPSYKPKLDPLSDM